MCMPRYFGSKVVDGKKEEKKQKPQKEKKSQKQVVIQTTVEFEE